MGIGIDWVAVVLLLGAYALAQVRSIPVSVRYGIFAAVSAGIAVWKLRAGGAGPNLTFAIIAGGLAVWYAIKAFAARR